jgi:hypothetical protein
VNYRANLWALKDSGVETVVSVASVGGIQCTGNTMCTASTGRCTPGTAVCTSDAQCSAPSTVSSESP